MPSFGELVGGLMVVGAMAVVSYVVITTGSQEALIALIAIAIGGKEYFLRGRVQPPTP